MVLRIRRALGSHLSVPRGCTLRASWQEGPRGWEVRGRPRWPPSRPQAAPRQEPSLGSRARERRSVRRALPRRMGQGQVTGTQGHVCRVWGTRRGTAWPGGWGHGAELGHPDSPEAPRLHPADLPGQPRRAQDDENRARISAGTPPRSTFHAPETITGKVNAQTQWGRSRATRSLGTCRKPEDTGTPCGSPQGLPRSSVAIVAAVTQEGSTSLILTPRGHGSSDGLGTCQGPTAEQRPCRELSPRLSVPVRPLGGNVQDPLTGSHGRQEQEQPDGAEGHGGPA